MKLSRNSRSAPPPAQSRAPQAFILANAQCEKSRSPVKHHCLRSVFFPVNMHVWSPGVLRGLTALAPPWCHNPSVHMEPRHMLDPKLLPSQFPDANQSINNRDHARGSSFHNVTGNRHWSQQRKTLYTGVQEWRVALCTLAKTPPTPKSTPTCLLFYWLALSVARKTLCCSWALSISFLFFFLFFFSFAFGALFPIPGEREMKTCQKSLFL